MNDEVKANKVFKKQAGPRALYGDVTLVAFRAEGFIFTGFAQWKNGYDAVRYNAAIRDGILAAFAELDGVAPAGRFVVESVGYSDLPDANVPIAYKHAAKGAAADIVGRWARNQEGRNGGASNGPRS